MAKNSASIVDRLISAYFLQRLRSYRGNLTSVVAAKCSNVIPTGNEPQVVEYVEKLRNYMKDLGRPEEDDFLLRYALTVPGSQRGVTPPLIALDADRGGFSKRRLDEAGGQITRLREAIAIGKQIIYDPILNTEQLISRLVDLVSDPSSTASSDEILIDTHRNLDGESLNELTESAIEIIDAPANSDIGIELLRNQANYSRLPLNESTCFALIDREVFYPASLYRDSGDRVAQQLAARIEHPAEGLKLNHLLLALAWTRSEVAREAFSRWMKKSPMWAKQLHIAPQDYLPYAGWCLGASHERSELISENCFRLALDTDGASRKGAAVPCRTPIDEKCPSCEGPLGLLFDFSSLDEKYFIEKFAEAPRRIMYCYYCSSFGTVFSSYRTDGEIRWHSTTTTEHESEAWERIDSSLRIIGSEPFPPFAAAKAFGLSDASTFGGIPMWLQDANFPRCIECEKFMVFLAQHDNSAHDEEGIFYAFFCPNCCIAAVNFQCT